MKPSDQLKKKAREAFPDPGLPKSDPYNLKEIAATQEASGQARCAEGAGRENRATQNKPPPDPPEAQKTQHDQGSNGTQEPVSSSEELNSEARIRFNRYLQDRSVFPADIRLEALHGIAGQVVRLMAEHCEASFESLLFQFLVACGNLLGKCAYVYAGGPWLFPNEFTICVGVTARGRKGTAWRMIEHLFKVVAPEWLDSCHDTDVQSGEGIVYRIRDEIKGVPKQDRRKKPPNEPPVETVLDPGVTDKRLQIVEEEISNVLKMARRQGNTLTETYRKGWDSPRSLRTSNKNSPLTASDPHISLIGHTNKEELLETLNDIELSNGFANRILWCASKRRVSMPDAEYLDWKAQPSIISELKFIFKQYFANSDNPTQFKRTTEANKLWKALYQRLNNQKHVSFIDGVLVRDTSHLLKLALIYAILDRCDIIDVEHLEAALAVCDYSQATARWLFAERTGNRLGNMIYWALLRAPEGMTRTQINDDICYRNTPKIQLDQAFEALAKNGMVRLEIREPEHGKKIEVWHANLEGSLGGGR